MPPISARSCRSSARWRTVGSPAALPGVVGIMAAASMSQGLPPATAACPPYISLYREEAIYYGATPRPPVPMTRISFEFYPPKTDEQRQQLERTVRKLKA